MQVNDKLLRQLTEVKYLNADNVDRYRCIMRIFYDNYEKLKYWLYQEDVYGQLKEFDYFADYRMEQCQQDLAALTEWGNLIPIQDTRRVTSIEEFKNKKYRYQMSEYSVEIERLVVRLENLFIETASLEPTLFERIRKRIEQFPQMRDETMEHVSLFWNDLNNDFIRLNQNYQDYMRDLNGVKAEEMMRTKEFLLFKDKLVEYLRSFIKGLQSNLGAIEELLAAMDMDQVQEVLDKVTAYRISIPRMDVELPENILEEQIKTQVFGSYRSIYEWFVGAGNGENEAGKLFDATNEIIRRITRYATQLSEKNGLGANRREEYRTVASIFMKCENMEQAHKMSAMVFGLERPYHVSGEIQGETESMNMSVYDVEPITYTLKPRIRTYREKSNRSAMKNNQEEKNAMRQKLLLEMQMNQKKIQTLETDGRIEFHKLPVLEPQVREILLVWLSNALESPDYSARTDDGRTYVLDMTQKEKKCIVHCEDGDFTMPQISIVFQE